MPLATIKCADAAQFYDAIAGLVSRGLVVIADAETLTIQITGY